MKENLVIITQTDITDRKPLGKSHFFLLETWSDRDKLRRIRTETVWSDKRKKAHSETAKQVLEQRIANQSRQL